MKVMKLAVMALAGMMVTSPAWAEKKGKAENGPSAQETVKFIAGLYACQVVQPPKPYNPEFNCDDPKSQDSTIEFSGNGLLTINEHTKESLHCYGNANPYRNFSVFIVGDTLSSFQANELLDENITVQGNDVHIPCNPMVGACFKYHSLKVNCAPSNDRKGDDRCSSMDEAEQIMARHKQSGVGVSQKSSTSWYMNFCDPDKAQRAAKAMKHLIKISGAKKSLF